MRNSYNIYWFIIDSVRTYKTEVDDRDRLDIMDEFAKDSIEYSNCVTGAPSSLLAAGAMFTGLPSVFVARHFNDWKFKDSNLSTIKTLVDEHGYTSYPLIDSRDAREFYQHLLPLFPSKKLPPKFKLRDYAWTNREITEIFKYMYEKDDKTTPSAYVFWYDCRRDPTVSSHVNDAIQLIKDKGDYDNSIIIMQSDHGYPDPRTNLNESYFSGLGHDMILTDDNIKTPLFLKYPGCEAGVIEHNIVGHIDILPTIYDILNIPMTKSKDNNRFRGRSLINKSIDDEIVGRILRTDTRLTMDLGRITSLRSNRYKYLYFHDENVEMLFDIENDPKELDNKVNEIDSKIVSCFRDKMDEYDNGITSFHHDVLLNNATKQFHKYNIIKTPQPESICIVTKAPKRLIELLLKSIDSNLSVGYELTIIFYGGILELISSELFIHNIQYLNEAEIENLNLRSFDLTIYLTENSKRVYLKPEVYKGVKSIKSNSMLLFNYNFEGFNYFKSRWFPSGARLFFSWDRKGYLYKQEPITLIQDIFSFIMISFRTLLGSGTKTDYVAAKEIFEYRNYNLKKNDGQLTDENIREEKNMAKWRDD
jgi:hypothetical protein